jgi:diaminopimelate epimerase
VPLEVRLPGGPLTIVVGEDLVAVEMRGPAEKVFAGTTGI